MTPGSAVRLATNCPTVLGNDDDDDDDGDDDGSDNKFQ